MAMKQKQLDATKEVVAENEKSLTEMTAECYQKQLSFDEKQRLRKEELQAIEEAIKILQSPEVSGNYEKYVVNLSREQGGRTALVQIADQRGKAAQGSEGIRQTVRRFLEAEGRRLHSQRLGLLSQKLAA